MLLSLTSQWASLGLPSAAPCPAPQVMALDLAPYWQHNLIGTSKENIDIRMQYTGMHTKLVAYRVGPFGQHVGLYWLGPFSCNTWCSSTSFDIPTGQPYTLQLFTPTAG